MFFVPMCVYIFNSIISSAHWTGNGFNFKQRSFSQHSFVPITSMHWISTVCFILCLCEQWGKKARQFNFDCILKWFNRWLWLLFFICLFFPRTNVSIRIRNVYEFEPHSKFNKNSVIFNSIQLLTCSTSFYLIELKPYDISNGLVRDA